MSKFSKQVLSVIKTVAPGIAATIGGPFGGIAAAALQQAFGTEKEAELEKQLAVADPAALAKLKEAEVNFDLECEKLGLTRDQLLLEDVQDARGLAAKLGTIWPQFTIFVTLTVIIGSCIWLLFTMEMPDPNKSVLIMILGNAVTAWLASIYFFTGTSKGSLDKGNQLARLK